MTCRCNLGERARGAVRAERVRATVDLPGYVRVPYGPGWALAGDAGLSMDPLTGQGIANALRDAEELALAVTAGFSGGGRALRRALGDYRRRRDAQTLPMYKFTAGLAALRPEPAGSVLFPVLAADQARTDEFLGVLAGTVPADRYFSARNLVRILGVRGMLAAARARSWRLPAVAARPVPWPGRLSGRTVT